MALQTAEALILDVTDLHDRDRIVTFLTREYGKKRGVARGARGKPRRFRGPLPPPRVRQEARRGSWRASEAQPLRRSAPAARQSPGDLVRERGERSVADFLGGVGED